MILIFCIDRLLSKLNIISLSFILFFALPFGETEFLKFVFVVTSSCDEIVVVNSFDSQIHSSFRHSPRFFHIFLQNPSQLVVFCTLILHTLFSQAINWSIELEHKQSNFAWHSRKVFGLLSRIIRLRFFFFFQGKHSEQACIIRKWYMLLIITYFVVLRNLSFDLLNLYPLVSSWKLLALVHRYICYSRIGRNL